MNPNMRLIFGEPAVAVSAIDFICMRRMVCPDHAGRSAP